MCFLAYIPPQKICSHCKKSLDWEHFSSAKRHSADGMLYICRACNSIKNEASYNRNQAKRVANARNKRLTQPELMSQQRKARYWRNPEHHRALASQSAQRYPERVKARQATAHAAHRQERLTKMQQRYAANKEPWQRWAQEHPESIRLVSAKRRARKRSLPDTFTLAERQFMVQYWGHACAICGNEEGFFWQLADDHWVPLKSAQCPGTVADNIVPLCHGIKGCNNAKNRSEPEVWLCKQFGPRKAKAILQKITAYFDVVRARKAS